MERLLNNNLPLQCNNCKLIVCKEHSAQVYEPKELGESYVKIFQSSTPINENKIKQPAIDISSIVASVNSSSIEANKNNTPVDMEVIVAEKPFDFVRGRPPIDRFYQMFRKLPARRYGPILCRPPIHQIREK